MPTYCIDNKDKTSCLTGGQRGDKGDDCYWVNDWDNQFWLKNAATRWGQTNDGTTEGGHGICLTKANADKWAPTQIGKRLSTDNQIFGDTLTCDPQTKECHSKMLSCSREAKFTLSNGNNTVKLPRNAYNVKVKVEHSDVKRNAEIKFNYSDNTHDTFAFKGNGCNTFTNTTDSTRAGRQCEGTLTDTFIQSLGVSKLYSVECTSAVDRNSWEYTAKQGPVEFIEFKEDGGWQGLKDVEVSYCTPD